MPTSVKADMYLFYWVQVVKTDFKIEFHINIDILHNKTFVANTLGFFCVFVLFYLIFLPKCYIYCSVKMCFGGK